VNARWVKPLDTELLAQFVKPGTKVITAEENQLAGGFGSAVVEALEEIGVSADVKRLGIPDRFVPHATQAEQRRELGLDEDGLLASFREHFAAKGDVVPLATRSA
jgi:1-deoxy-D-xylulose-5-phosphate synthase